MRTFIRPLAALVSALALVSTPLMAQEEACEPTPPAELGEQTVNTVLEQLTERRDEFKKNPQALYAMIERELVPLVDLERMSELVLGKHAEDASDEQIDRFAQAFKQMIIQTYGNALYGFDDEQIEFQPVDAPEDATDITFQAVVITEEGDRIPVDMDMHLVDCQWKIYDGSIGNLSFVTNYRGQFNAQIRAGGLDALIEKMESRYGGGVSDPAQ